MYENVVVVTGKVCGRQVEALLDLGSTRNFLSTQFVEQNGLKMDETREQMTLADGSKLLIDRTVNFIFKSGSVKCSI